MVHAGGRPRTVSPSPEECIELGKEMVEWVIKHKPTHLSEWFSIEKMIPWKMWNAMCELPEFLPYYEVSLNLVAQNCRNGGLNPSIAQRFLSLYHRDLKKDERDEAAYNSSLKKQENNTAEMLPELLTQHTALMQLISAAQSNNKPQ